MFDGIVVMSAVSPHPGWTADSPGLALKPNDQHGTLIFPPGKLGTPNSTTGEGIKLRQVKKNQHIQTSLHMLATVDGWRCGRPIIGFDGQEKPALGPAPRGLGDDAVDEERRPVELPLGNGLRQAPRVGGREAPRTLGLCCVATHPLARGYRLEV